jgi:glutathione synthase/RimK-type ligase-like ATP-grasp enzyme
MVAPYAGRGWFADTLRRLCARRGVAVHGRFDDWLLRLEPGGGRPGRVVFGTDFGLDTSVATALCRDKCAASALLAEAGLPAVPHALILPAVFDTLGEGEGGYAKARRLFALWGGDVVAKPNTGTGGRDVERLRTLSSVDDHLRRHLAVDTARLALSPFRAALHETRVILLDGEGLLAYRKTLSGDGWRFNLSAGATPSLLPEAEAAPLVSLARSAAAVFGLRLAVVDLLETAAGPVVMEVNTGLYMKSFAQGLADGQRIAEDVYDRVLDALLTGRAADIAP